jgi:hypothetical protein
MSISGWKWAAAWASAGAALAGFVVGAWLGPMQSVPRVQAVSSLAEESFVACTAPVDGVNEGFFILDFETGDLSGGVINSSSSKFVRSYRYNVLNDLGFKAGRVKKPKFLLLPGLMAFAAPAGNQLGTSVLYVTDVSTGVTMAYGIPWNSQQAGAAGVQELVPLDIAKPRGGGAP